MRCYYYSPSKRRSPRMAFQNKNQSKCSQSVSISRERQKTSSVSLHLDDNLQKTRPGLRTNVPSVSLHIPIFIFFHLTFPFYLKRGITLYYLESFGFSSAALVGVIHLFWAILERRFFSRNDDCVLFYALNVPHRRNIKKKEIGNMH